MHLPHITEGAWERPTGTPLKRTVSMERDGVHLPQEARLGPIHKPRKAA